LKSGPSTLEEKKSSLCGMKHQINKNLTLYLFSCILFGGTGI
jgi:hypothetical protein